MKRGQITIFIIIGIIILFIIALAILFYPEQKAMPEETSFPAIQTFTEKCIELTARNAVIHVSHEGGYYDNEELSIFYPPIWGDNIPLYFSPDENNLPTKEIFESSIEQFMKINLPICTNGFEEIEKEGISVEETSPEINATILKSRVLLDVDYPLTLREGNRISGLSKFNTALDIDALGMLDAAEEIVNTQKETPESLSISELSRISSEKNILFSITSFDGVDVITLKKNQSGSSEPYEFSFALGYDNYILERPEE